MPQYDRSHKHWHEANGGAQCGKSACCVRRGGGRKRGMAGDTWPSRRASPRPYLREAGGEIPPAYSPILSAKSGCCLMLLKAAHTSDAPFDPAMVLFESVVQVDARPVTDVAAHCRVYRAGKSYARRLSPDPAQSRQPTVPSGRISELLSCHGWGLASCRSDSHRDRSPGTGSTSGHGP